MAIPNSFTNGTIADADKVNENFTYVDDRLSTMEAVYTGSDFDSSISTANNSDEQSYEMPAISSDELTGFNYLVITITGTTFIQETTVAAKTEIKIQTRAVGDSYSDSLGYTPTVQRNASTDATPDFYLTNTIRWVHTLTNDEKTNGVQIKLFSKSTVGNSNIPVSWTNVQSTVEAIK